MAARTVSKLFIDGREGTTGLEIYEHLKRRPDVELVEIPADKRKDPQARRQCINAADFVIVCLPDAAARESVSLLENERTRVLDASTAHRTAPGWVYGFPELEPGQREAIRAARFVAVPGCHASGFVAALKPLVMRGLLNRDYPLTAFSLTGYSGGGRKMIEEYEAATGEEARRLACPRPYALGLKHKHLPEMQAVVGLDAAPCFEPVVSNFRQGMLVSIPLLARALPRAVTPSDVHAALAEHYASERFVRVMPLTADGPGGSGHLSPLDCNGTNRLELFVFGHAEQILLVARLDNLGKGASGAAVQCLNLMLGADEATGLSA